MALTIVKAEKRGEHLFLTVQGASVTEVTSAAARKFAYDARGEYGFDNAGIEAAGGSFPVDLKGQDPDGKEGEKGAPITSDQMAEISKRTGDLAYRHTYRLTRGI